MLTTIMMSLTATLSPVDASATTSLIEIHKVETVQINEDRRRSNKKLSFQRANEDRRRSNKKL